MSPPRPTVTVTGWPPVASHRDGCSVSPTGCQPPSGWGVPALPPLAPASRSSLLHRVPGRWCCPEMPQADSAAHWPLPPRCPACDHAQDVYNELVTSRPSLCPRPGPPATHALRQTTNGAHAKPPTSVPRPPGTCLPGAYSAGAARKLGTLALRSPRTTGQR